MRSGASTGDRRRARGSRSGAEHTSGRGDTGQELPNGRRRYQGPGAWTRTRARGRQGKQGRKAKLDLAALREGSGFLGAGVSDTCGRAPALRRSLALRCEVLCVAA